MSPCRETIEYARRRTSSPSGIKIEMNWPGMNSSCAPSRICKKIDRVSSLWSTMRLTTESQMPRGEVTSAIVVRATLAVVALTREVNRKARNDHSYFGVGIGHHRLAAEARSRRQPGRLVEHVLLGFFGLAQFAHPFLDDHMTGGACAVAAARVFEMNLVTEQDIENRAGAAIMMKRRIGRIELDQPVGVAIFKFNAQFRHYRVQDMRRRAQAKPGSRVCM